MRVLNRSDFWFALLLVPFLAFAIFLSGVGDVVQEPVNLLKFLVIACIAYLYGKLQFPLSQMDIVARSISWFSIGVTVFAIWMFLEGEEFELPAAAMLGIFLVALSLLPDLRRKGNSQ
ncbi:hypothetical protein [Parasphingopyxis marina]|uniref:Uncharacterized protein n=1 Tax=Parasphingopyxis marina TaxID=2761622 RepID=A0A842HYS6_9SPHN|nr:hypothetical protein [Parasphingopyxis marina]MBC2777583.1 hypothetical protein [Parasphingopyxis marina]